MLTLLKKAVSAIPTPGSGKGSFFIDSADGIPSVKDESGTVTKLGGLPPTRNLSAGAGLTGGGTLAADRTFDVAAGDGSIVVSPDSIAVGVISDAQHGGRSGGTLHAAATQAAPGFMTAIDKAYVDHARAAVVYATDYGADPTGVADSLAAINAAIAALPGGGIVYFAPGTYLISATLTVGTAHVRLIGASRYATTIKCNLTTGDMVVLAQWYNTVEDLSFVGPGSGQVATKTSGFAINAGNAAGAYSTVRRCSFSYQYDCVNLSNTLATLEEAECRYFAHSAVVVNQNSDHQIDGLTCDNNAGALPTGAGIDVQVCASLLLSNCNVIHSNFALNISPATGVTVPSVKGVNCFFDTSVVGLNMTGAGSVLRSEFTNCWFSSMSQFGINMNPSGAGQVNGITFVNCDIYNNVGGTTVGVFAGALVGKWKMIGCSIAGWTQGLSLVPGANHFPTILSNTIGAVSAFGVNGTGVVVAAGTYKGLVLANNDVVDNTVAYTLGALTIAAASAAMFRIIDNAGINPRGTASVAPVATPVLATVYTNTSGFRVLIVVKHGATANTAVVINGVTVTAAFVAAQIATYTLEPGGTISIVGGTAPTVWSWIPQ